MYEQSYAFSFEAAHSLPDSDDVGYQRVHGHSFVVTATLRAAALADDKWVCDFADVRAACDDVKSRLDHRVLNDDPGIARPTLENVAAWIFAELALRLPALAMVEVARPTLGERVSFAPPRA
ncbi:MAG: 6-pyruvoyl tetrahydropterin synthase family protein [Parvularculaceae bacterium]